MVIRNKKSGHKQTVTPDQWKAFKEKRIATQLPHENMQMAYEIVDHNDEEGKGKVPAQLKTTQGQKSNATGKGDGK